MKYLTLLFLVGCIGFDKDVLHPTKAQLCAAEIRRYEHLQLYPPASMYNYDICEISLTMDQCDCAGYKVLPLNCVDTYVRFNERIESREKALKEWQGIIKEAKKKTKNDKETLRLLNNMYNDDKQELKELKQNMLDYMEMCKENK